MSRQYDGAVDYDRSDDPADVYDIVSRSRYHSLSSSEPTQEGASAYRIDIPRGTVNVGNAWASVANDRYGLEPNEHGRVDELWQEFWLYIPEDFVLDGTDHRFWVSAISYSSGSGHSGGGQPDGTNGWSVRLQLANRGEPGFNLVEYTYNMDERIYDIHDAPIDHGWNHFETHVKCNTYENGQANADGLSECWVDGELVYSNDGIRFTTDPANEIEYGGVAGYYGGGGAPQDVSLVYDAHKLDADPNEETATSQPSVPFDSALAASAESAADRILVHDSHEMAAGNRYEATVAFDSTEEADMGLLFGAQSAGGFDSYTGYLALCDLDDGEIRLDRWTDGSLATSEAASASIPAGEQLTLGIDWRSTDASETRFSIRDDGGTELAVVSTSDTTHDRGRMGIYRYHADRKWYLDEFGQVGVDDGSDDGSEEESGGGSDDGESPGVDHLVAFVTEPGSSLCAHEFLAEGAVAFAEAPYDSPSGRAIEGGTYTAEDFVEERDGVWHAGGVTGNGYGDAYRVEGPITDVTVEQPDGMWIELDGQRVTGAELIERTGGADDEGRSDDGNESDDGSEDAEPTSHTLEVAGQFAYRVEVSGEIQPAEAHAKWLTEGEAYGDDWAEWWLSGSDEAYTVWEFTGEITTLDVSDHDGVTEIRTLAVDGEPIEEV
ncbi:hypothetical protein [Halovivax limisalsi]|uniref:hypothetical protein n=1 Tax=Halovivax limisalsi TaxID=1453760 RepID=UPI001FFD6AEA|nr:hypothetical protein [Halovivax limisalsi]